MKRHTVKESYSGELLTKYSHLGLTTDQQRLILSSNKNEKHLCHKKYPKIRPNSRTVLKSGCHDSEPLDFELETEAFGLVCP